MILILQELGEWILPTSMKSRNHVISLRAVSVKLSIFELHLYVMDYVTLLWENIFLTHFCFVKIFLKILYSIMKIYRKILLKQINLI